MAPEQKQVHHALGIDFGTSNSYLSEVRVGGLDLAYTDLKFHNGQSSVPTCVLYQKKQHSSSDKFTTSSESPEKPSSVVWEPCAFGDAAIELWKDLRDQERTDYWFRGGFKPDLAFDAQAYRDTVSFFRCLREYLQEQRIIHHFSPASGRQVVVGVPARNVTGQEEKTLTALAEAGILDAIVVPEPVGALFYHLYYDRNLITVERAHQGVLVVDFGGGTFDAAFLQDGDVQNHWGNPMLGGRLFDDLFYQWFLEQQGTHIRRDMEQDGTLSYLRTFGFRRLKERFSTAWNSQQLGRFRERITVGADFDYGVFRNATEQEFLQRSRQYRASADLLQDLAWLQDDCAQWLKQGPVDLMAEIQRQLTQPKTTKQPESKTSVNTVILTGGSCRWPFMMEMTQQCFPGAAIFQSPDPEATISRGLALSYAFRSYSKDIGLSLSSHRSELRTQLLEIIENNYKMFATRLAERFTNEWYVAQIHPIFVRWKETGGAIADLEREASKAAHAYFEAEGQQVVQREQIHFQERVQQVLNDCLVAWLRKHRITRSEYLSVNALHQLNHDDLGWDTGFHNIMNDFFQATKWLISSLVGVVVAALAGGGGAALIMSGPLGWLIGLVLGVTASLALLGKVDAHHIPIPSWILKRTATEERLDETKHKFRQDIEDNLIEIFQQQQSTIEKELHQQVDSLIQRISQHIPVTAVIDKS